MKSLHQHLSLFPLLSNALNELLLGYALKDAYRNQAADELNLVFEKGRELLSMQLNTSCKTALFFFYEYPLLRTGSVFPLFKELVGKPILQVQAHAFNRSFQLNFGSNQTLVFKLYGPLSNVLYYEGEKVVNLFRTAIENDWHLPIEGFNQAPSDVALPKFEGLFYVSESSEGFCLSFEKPNGKIVLETEVIFEALHTFSKYFLQQYTFITHRNKLLGIYKQKVKRDNALVHGAEQFLKYAETAVPYDEIGHILMANLHQINRGDTEVVLDNFYRNEPITIELKKDLSPQNNAANYYQKAKNRKKELGLKQKQHEACSIRLQENNTILEKIENAQFLKDLKPWLKEEKAGNEVPLKEKFRKFECQGFQIYVGKNAKNNDELTLKFAHKEDLWLHAKGVSGSHVIIKHKQMQSFPQPVIEKAAQIAAHYSSSAGSQLVPVIFTPKKFVRKPKGANPGQVSVEKEEVILVEPKINSEF
jgi:predicted ribosome quality control (RQC) complex YloA/Tae2 family protein